MRDGREHAARPVGGEGDEVTRGGPGQGSGVGGGGSSGGSGGCLCVLAVAGSGVGGRGRPISVEGGADGDEMTGRTAGGEGHQRVSGGALGCYVGPALTIPEGARVDLLK